MRLKLLFTFALLLSVPGLLLAQAAVEFPVKTLDIGKISEDTDSVNGVFRVVNRGDAPLFIESRRPSGLKEDKSPLQLLGSQNDMATIRLRYPRIPTR